ncbi:hypothetical protein [Dyadobacter sp. CY343]|uniref:hypothetical protein n=1 Tax=Dyadobacter sp. CY343 TaxID=2907299 RepID=UPI001F185DD4|nr:hypothetical protein [Dyadobacter sp. CY343]MCE7063386.1 hypothetical protein [Dyadobacter sp. CY343]
MNNPALKWTHYLACFFSGFWALNLLPHLVHGINGQGFPTPFTSPPFKGLSTRLVNTVLALSNIVLAYWLGRVGRLSPWRPAHDVALFPGLFRPGVLYDLCRAENVGAVNQSNKKSWHLPDEKNLIMAGTSLVSRCSGNQLLSNLISFQTTHIFY